MIDTFRRTPAGGYGSLGFTGTTSRGAPAPSPRSAVARVLRQIAVRSLFADVVFLVVAMALGGVEGNVGRAAGALVALVVLGDRRNSLRHPGLRYQRKEPTPAATKSFPRTTAWPPRTPSVAAGRL